MKDASAPAFARFANSSARFYLPSRGYDRATVKVKGSYEQ